MKSNLNIKSIIIIAIIGVLSLVFFGKSFAANTAKVNVDTANIRETASADATIVEQAAMGEDVEILEKAGEWYKVKYNNVEGYIKAELLDVPQEKATEVKEEQPKQEESNKVETKQDQTVQKSAETTVKAPTTGSYVCKKDTKLRVLPLIGGKVLQEVKAETKVNVLVVNNKWAYVEVDARRGWILFSKLEKEVVEEAVEEEVQEQPEVVEKTMYVNTETLNLRAEATTDSQSLAKLTMGTEVIVYSENDGWSKVKVDGIEGYVSSSLLTDRKPEDVTSRGLEEERQQVEQEVQETPAEEPAEEPAASTATVSGGGSAMGQEVCNYARQFLGCPYVYGGTSPDGFDCSGFTQYVYSNFGVDLNRTAADQAYNGVEVDRSELQPGDILIFSGHAGLYLGDGEFIHAENYSTGVVESSIDQSYYANHYITARRIFE